MLIPVKNLAKLQTIGLTNIAWIKILKDAVDATVRAGNLDFGELPKPFDVGGGVSASLGEVMSLVEEITGASLRIDQEPTAAGDPLITVASTDFTESTLGWKASTGLQEGLLLHYESLRETASSSI